MCGILGVLGPAAEGIEQGKFEHTLSLLQHRGPDGTRTWSGRNILFGHTRLSIVDLSEAASQPMPDRSSRFRIIYNGEIYNYKEIRQELEQEGVTFLTQSDTEVILEAYKRWGLDCQARFNGMWAFALYDTEKEELLFSRDRFGVKPFYYAELRGNLIFASEMKALLDLGVDSEADWGQINRYLMEWGSDAAGGTPFKHIHLLPAGHCMLVSSSGRRLVRWWNLAERLVEVPDRFEERISHFKELFEDAVRLRLRNDVDTGVTLSGGLDSSSVYGAARKLHQHDLVRTATTNEAKNFRTFSVSFPGNALDEYPWAAQCIRFWNDDARAEVIRPVVELFPEMIEDIIWHQEVPFFSASVMVYHLLYRHIASLGTRVVLEGHGGDELFGGYREEVRTAVQTYAARGQLGLAWKASRCMADMINIDLEESPRKATTIFLGALSSTLRSKRRAGQAGFPSVRRHSAPYYQMRMRYFHPLISTAYSSIVPETVNGFSPFNQELYVMFSQKFLPTILHVFDRATMTYSVESRSPFMDHRIVQFAFSLPESDKVARRTKEIVRRAAGDWMPESVINRKVKMPFTTAERDWFESPTIGNYLRDIFNSRDALQSELFNGKQVASDLERFKKDGFTRMAATRVWKVLNIHLWHKRLVEPYRS